MKSPPLLSRALFASLLFFQAEAFSIENQGRVFHTESIHGFTIHFESTISPADIATQRTNISAGLAFLIQNLPHHVDMLRISPMWIRDEVFINDKTGNEGSGQASSSEPWFGVSHYHPRTTAFSAESYVRLTLHEYAHILDARIASTDEEEARIQSVYDNAISQGLYLNVPNLGGGTEAEAYARVDPVEYFAELMESYFGLNYTFPYNATELEAYDPLGYALVARILSKSISESFQPDLEERKNRSSAVANEVNLYESRPKKQKIYYDEDAKKFKARILLANDGEGFDRYQPQLRRFKAKRLRKFSVWSSAADRFVNRRAELKRGDLLLRVSGDGWTNLLVVSKRLRSSKKSERSLEIRVSSEVVPSKADSIRHEIRNNP